MAAAVVEADSEEETAADLEFAWAVVGMAGETAGGLLAGRGAEGLAVTTAVGQAVTMEVSSGGGHRQAPNRCRRHLHHGG